MQSAGATKARLSAEAASQRAGGRSRAGVVRRRPAGDNHSVDYNPPTPPRPSGRKKSIDKLKKEEEGVVQRTISFFQRQSQHQGVDGQAAIYQGLVMAILGASQEDGVLVNGDKQALKAIYNNAAKIFNDKNHRGEEVYSLMNGMYDDVNIHSSMSDTPTKHGINKNTAADFFTAIGDNFGQDAETTDTEKKKMSMAMALVKDVLSDAEAKQEGVDLNKSIIEIMNWFKCPDTFVPDAPTASR